MKKIVLIALILPSLSFANVQNHNIYVQKSGLDTSIYNNIQTPKIVDYSALIQSKADAKARKDAKQAELRQAEYAKDLITGTNGLKEVSSETILPLIEKYPENAEKLLNLLQK